MSTGDRFDPFAGSGPRWRAVPAWRPFLEDLAAGVLHWLGDQTLRDYVRTSDALQEAIGKPIGQWTRTDEMRVGRILTGLKWTRKKQRVDGVPTWVFVPVPATGELFPTSENT